MLNFEGVDKVYRAKVYWAAEDILDKTIVEYLLRGGHFDRSKITTMFDDAVRSAQCIIDLHIGIGLRTSKDETDTNDKDHEFDTDNDKKPGCQFRTTSTRTTTTPIKDEVSDLGEGSTEGPPGGLGDKNGVRDTGCTEHKINNNGAARSGEVNPA